MKNTPIPFQLTNWDSVPATEHKGETGMALWKTLQYDNLRIRVVEYSANYLADHWCEKGHVIYCLEGEMITTLADGKEHILKAGMSYQVSDGLSSHKTYTKTGAKLFIVDGEFLKV
ncbi:MAG TPA: DHCW motif cupin fold protein [Bacteroidia bacterium]|jgi:quercetin dioxygenase-like cupin family protein|nr:DHCW motif cupin fold protein [Bacteroidia bacterium]